MTPLLVIIAAVYGLIIGSFLNAWAWRLAHHESITQGRSHCPHCGHQIRGYDNVPVVSWLLLRGRCRDCGAPISWRYPLGEAVTAAVYVGVVLRDGQLGAHPAPAVRLRARARQPGRSGDPHHPRRDRPAGHRRGRSAHDPVRDGPWWEWLVAGAGAAGLLFLISEVYYRVRHVEGMGFGDVKLALCMGIYLGAAVVPALFLGFLSGALIGVVIVTASKGDGKTAIPFGPFLAAGAVVALFAGTPLIDAYLHLALGR